MSFESLGLRAELLQALADSGYTEPTPVQAAAIPPVLEGRDVLAGAQTGTGKTAAFVLPILQRLNDGAKRAIWPKRVRVLILTPTRELAAQVEESVRTYGKRLRPKSAVVYGGVGYAPQVQAMARGLDFLVATPGRLLDHVQQGTVDLSAVETFVLDEADRMLDMGFIRDIRKVLTMLPKKKQSLLFSATFPSEIVDLANSLLDNPVRVEIERKSDDVELIEQSVFHTTRESKKDLLIHLIQEDRIGQALVFTRTKHGADRLAAQLQRAGIHAAPIHGDRSQSQRTRALGDFKSGRVDILVATDIAARGLDIDQLPHVINYELPHVAEDYVHRIGRTGRAGSKGEAISLVCSEELSNLASIEKLIKKRILLKVNAKHSVSLEEMRPPASRSSSQGRRPRSGGNSGYGGGSSSGGSRGSWGSGRERSARFNRDAGGSGRDRV